MIAELQRSGLTPVELIVIAWYVLGLAACLLARGNRP